MTTAYDDDLSLDDEPDDDFVPERWRPVKVGLTPDFTAPTDPNREFDEGEILHFFEKLAEGYGPFEIGLSIGWSPAAIKRFLADEERGEIIEAIEERKHEGAERAIYRNVLSGNATAQRLYAFSKMRHRGWADQRDVSVDIRAHEQIVVSVRQAMENHTAELISAHGEDGVAALQDGLIDDDDIVDAEVVDE